MQNIKSTKNKSPKNITSNQQVAKSSQHVTFDKNYRSILTSQRAKRKKFETLHMVKLLNCNSCMNTILNDTFTL